MAYGSAACKGCLDPLTIMGFFNWYRPGHTIRDCPQQLTGTSAANHKLENISKKRKSAPALAGILFQICRQLDGEGARSEDTLWHIEDSDDESQLGIAEPSDDAAIEAQLFDALVVAATTREEATPTAAVRARAKMSSASEV